jgi:hypothetical protein
MLLSVAFHLTLTNSYSLLVAPVKRRIKAAFKSCANVDWPRVIEGVLELFERFVSNEVEARRGLYSIWKDHDDPHVRWTWLFCKSIYPKIIAGNRSSDLDHFARILFGMLIQVAESSVDRIRAILPPARNATNQEKNICTRHAH